MDALIVITTIALLVAASLVLGRRLHHAAQQTCNDAEDGAAAEQVTTSAAGPIQPPSQAAQESLGGAMPEVLVDPRIVVRKTTRRLHLFSDGMLVKSYRIALGANPEGDKEREGDGRTPEGGFYVCTRNPESNYHRALGLSYPTQEDADRGLEERLITTREYRRIVDALSHLRQPPWNTALGGEIMIHGHGADSDWTQGCIALADEDIEELFDAIPLGTSVVIEP